MHLIAVITWSWMNIATIASALLGVVALVVTIAGTFERMNLDTATELEPVDMPAPPEELAVLTAAGLHIVQTGIFRSSNLLRLHAWILLSPDETIVAMVYRSKVGKGARLTSRRADGVWIVTSMAIVTPSLQPSRVLIDAITGGETTAKPTLALHRLRLAEQDQEMEHFAPEDAFRATLEAHRAWHEDLVDGGMYRWADPEHNTARLTLKGSFFGFLAVRSIPQEAVRHGLRGRQILQRAAALPPLTRNSE